jgi:hypothetical protein
VKEADHNNLGKEPEIEGEDIGEINVNMNGSHIKKLKNKRGRGAPVSKSGEVVPDQISKDNKLATRGVGSFKNKTGVQGEEKG